MALAQRLTFDDNRQTSSISVFPIQKLESEYPSLSTTFFNKDNQKPAGYTPNTGLWFTYAPSQDKLIELEEYRGFSFVERGEIAVSYDKDNADFLHSSKFVCLNKQEHNDYYPAPYLIVCFELELEGSGNSKDEALDDLFQLLDIYFNRTREICENPVEYKTVINNNVYQQTPWKQSFARTYDRAQKLELINRNYQYHIREI
jgi:hypothetical protein